MNDASQCHFYCHNRRHALLQNFFLNQHKRDWIRHFHSIHWTHAITVSIHSASKSGNFQSILIKKISWPHKSNSAPCHQRINSYLLSLLYVQNSTGGRNSLFHANSFLSGLRSIPLTRGTFLLFGKSFMLMQRSRKHSRQLSFAPFFVKLMPFAFSISASFSAFFFSNSACLIFSSCAFRNNLIKFSRVVVTAIVNPITITS